MPKYRLRTLFVLVAVAAIVSLWVRYRIPDDVKNNSSLLAPLNTQMVTQPNGDLTSDLVTYASGDFGITEFGNVRMAVKGETFHGRFTSGRLLLGPGNNPALGSSGRSSDGTRTIMTHKDIEDGSSCTFVGLPFDIRNSRLELLGRSIPVDGRPTLVVVRDGEVDVFPSLIE